MRAVVGDGFPVPEVRRSVLERAGQRRGRVPRPGGTPKRVGTCGPGDPAPTRCMRSCDVPCVGDGFPVPEVRRNEVHLFRHPACVRRRMLPSPQEEGSFLRRSVPATCRTVPPGSRQRGGQRSGRPAQNRFGFAWAEQLPQFRRFRLSGPIPALRPNSAVAFSIVSLYNYYRLVICFRGIRLCRPRFLPFRNFPKRRAMKLRQTRHQPGWCLKKAASPVARRVP